MSLVSEDLHKNCQLSMSLHLLCRKSLIENLKRQMSFIMVPNLIRESQLRERRHHHLVTKVLHPEMSCNMTTEITLGMYLPDMLYFLHFNAIILFRQKYEVLKGLNAKQSVAFTFHCILPKPLWEWNEKSCMYMRFEGYYLGHWKNDVGEFKEGR